MIVDHPRWSGRAAGQQPGRTLIVAVLLALSAGCGAASHAAAVPSPKPVSTAALGTALLATAGRGPATVPVQGLTTGSHLAVRFACDGPGQVLLSDAASQEVLAVQGCSPHAIYDTGFTGTADDSQLTIKVDPSVSWNVGVWQQ